MAFNVETSQQRPRSFQRPRTAGAHYRPVSTILLEPVPGRQHRPSDPRRSIRPLSCVSDFIREMKPKEFVRFRNVDPPTDRMFTPHKIFCKLKRKSSMPLLNLNTASLTLQPPLATSKLASPNTPPPTRAHTPPPNPRYSIKDKINWIKRDNMTLHPYPYEAPYMQSYDPTVLENDRYTELLLRRLTPEGSPTFHDYGNKPPQAILDLGCGQGHWILAAAEVWKTSQFIGFDLVDLTSHMEKPDNVTFVRGNFLTRRLPFANKQFDLVRMANLSLCMPQAKWESLLTEVFRVLAVNGRLELIDDQIIFPYGPTPKSDSERIRHTSQPTSDWDDDYDDEDTLHSTTDSDSTFLNEVDSFPPSGDASGVATDLKPLRRYSDPLATEDLVVDSKRLSTERPASYISVPQVVDGSNWARQVEQYRNLETIFENMLKLRYDVDPCPSGFIPNVIRFVFGNDTEQQRTFQLKLAPANANEIFGRTGENGVSNDKEDAYSSDSSLGFPSSKRHRGKDKDLPIEPIPQDMVSIPDRISAKAAGRLGITYSALAAATAASVRNRTQTTRAQSPGLILWPSTYLPISPSELEMHACKNTHVLLGCKHPLEDYMQSFEEQDGKKYMDSHVIRDVLWEYECFRRERFHWPADVPDMRLETSETPAAPLSKGPIAFKLNAESSICPFTEEELTHVRTIHVFEAIKTSDYSLANLQFPRRPPPSPPVSS